MANISEINGFGFYAQTASFTVSSSVTTVKRGNAAPFGYLTSVTYYEPNPTHQQLLVIEGGGYFSSSFGSLRLHTPSVVATNGFTGSLQGTATTASYISPTFISASAAASGFGSGGGTSAPGTNLGLVYAVSLGYLMP